MNPLNDLLKSLFVMGAMVEARDPYTGGHIWRVSQFARLLAQDGGLPAREVARIALGGFLHDLGKIAVPDAILRKPGPLTETEFALVKTHPEVGNRLLAEHPLAPLAQPAVLEHHERPDGQGYPKGLMARQIRLDARIVGICDAFDAMTSNRPYHRGMSTGTALGVIQDNLGRQFDEEWGARFIGLGEAGELDPIVGHTELGIPLQPCPICGPNIVVRYRNQEGDLVYCRNCGTEMIIHRQGNTFSVEPTGRRGNAADLQPEADMDGINAMLRQFARQNFWQRMLSR